MSKKILTKKIVLVLVIATKQKVLMQVGTVGGKEFLKLPSAKIENAEDSVATRKALLAKALKKFVPKMILGEEKAQWREYVVDDTQFYVRYINFMDAINHLEGSKAMAFCYIDFKQLLLNQRVKVAEMGSFKTTPAYREALLHFFPQTKKSKIVKKTGRNGAQKIAAKRVSKKITTD